MRGRIPEVGRGAAVAKQVVRHMIGIREANEVSGTETGTEHPTTVRRAVAVRAPEVHVEIAGHAQARLGMGTP